MNVEKRIEIERKVVRHLIRTMKAAGWNVLNVDDGGDEMVECKTETETMDAVFSVDESHIYFRKPIIREGKEIGITHHAYIVLGNDGWDAICDYSFGPSKDDDFADIMGEIDKYTEKLSEEC